MIALALLLGTLASARPSPECERALFGDAIARRSASPAYVLVTAISGSTQRRWQVCVPAPLLLAAMRAEMGLGEDEAGALKAEEAALDRESLVFRFWNRKALKLLSPRYDKRVLDDVRSRVQGLSTDEIREGLASPEGALHRIYADGTSDWTAHRDALAHVLLERCIAAGFDEKNGKLWLGP